MALHIRTSSQSSSSTSLSDPDTLPFPKPLNRSAFLATDFDPAAYLSTLTNRFQTIEDLRTELASLSQTIENELVDLVNDNYSDFLSLGSSFLQGGEEKVEEVRVGLMGFERDVQGLREKVEGERGRVAELLEEKRRLMREAGVGGSLLEAEMVMGELEVELGLRKQEMTTIKVEAREEDGEGGGEEIEWAQEWDDDVDYDSEMDDVDGAHVPPRLRTKIVRYLTVKALMARVGKDHPFLMAEQGRLKKIRETVLLDTDAAIRNTADVKGKQAILRLRTEVEE